MCVRFALTIVPLLLVGCLSPPADVPEVDAAVQVDAAEQGELTVIVTDDGLPATGVPVLFHATDGSWLSTRRTDSDGRVVQHVTAGDAITVISDVADAPRVWTILAVEPGDELLFDVPPDHSRDLDVIATATLDYEPLDPPCLLTSNDGCGGLGDLSTMPLAASVLRRCVHDSEVWFVLTCQGGFNPPYTFAKIDLLPRVTEYAGTFTPITEQELETAVAFSTVGGEQILARLEVIAGPWAYLPDVYDASRGSVWQRRSPNMAPNGYRETVQVDFANTRRGYTINTAEPRDGVTEEVGNLLPGIELVERVPSPDGRHRLSWMSQEPIPAVADGILLHEDGWILVAPPSATSVVYPALPDEFAHLRLRFRAAGTIKLFDVSNIDSYRAFRSGEHSVRDNGAAYSPSEAVSPPTGVRWNWSVIQTKPT